MQCNSEVLNGIQDLEQYMFSDLYYEMDHQEIDTQMAYLLQHLLLCTNSLELQLQNSNLH